MSASLPAIDSRRGTLRTLLKLVWPVLIEQVLVMMVGLSDTMLAGKYLQREHLAAMTAASYALWAAFSLFSFVSIGATAMVARFVGGGDLATANRVMHQSYLAGIVLAVVATTGGLALGAQLLLKPFQLEEDVAALAAKFFLIVLPILPAMMLESIGIATLRGAGDMVTGLITMLAVNVTNIVVSWSLLLGLGPLPSLGWESLAIGTACGHLVGGIIPTVVLLRGRAGLHLVPRRLQFDVPLVRRVLRIGIPGGVDLMSIIACQLLFLWLINRLGTVATAAHGVAIRIESLAYLPGFAFQLAAATLSGQYLGARNHRQAARTVQVAAAACATLLLTMGLVFFAWADVLVGWFVRSDEALVAQEAAPLLRIVASVMGPLAVLMVLSGALRGAGDTRWPLAITFVGMLGVRVPLAWLLAHHLGYGVRGAWYAMAADLTVRCVLVLVRFRQGAWKRIEV